MPFVLSSAEKRKVAEVKAVEKEKKRKAEDCFVSFESGTESDVNMTGGSDFVDTTCDSEYEPFPKRQHNLKDIQLIAQTAIQYGISDEAAAAIANATLICYNVVNEEDHSNLIDRLKVRRAKQALFRENCDLRDNYAKKHISGIFLDGKTDIGLGQKMIDGKTYKVTTTEKHITMVMVPERQYLGHFVPPELPSDPNISPAENLANGFLHKLANMKIPTSLIQVIGGDSTAENTGADGGLFHFVEVKIGRKLLWIICCIHLNELPMRVILKHFIGIYIQIFCAIFNTIIIQ